MPKRKSRSIKTSAGSATLTPIKAKLTKKQLTDHLSDAIRDAVNDELSAKDAKRAAVAALDTLTNTMTRSLVPKSVGTFMMPKLFKVELKTRKAIKKGTMVRSPATGGMVPSKGRPETKRVKIKALANLKKAAAGEL